MFQLSSFYHAVRLIAQSRKPGRNKEAWPNWFGTSASDWLMNVACSREQLASSFPSPTSLTHPQRIERRCREDGGLRATILHCVDCFLNLRLWQMKLEHLDAYFLI